MNKLTPFLWFEDDAEEAAASYLATFPATRNLGELRSSGVGPWPKGELATIMVKLDIATLEAAAR